MQEAEGVTEELKALDQLAWVGAMNSIRSRAEEIPFIPKSSPTILLGINSGNINGSSTNTLT